MLQAYKGYFQNGQFIPSEPVTIPDNTEVYVVLVGDGDESYYSQQAHQAAFEDFVTAMGEIDNEPLDDEFDALLSKRVNFSRDLSL